MKRVEWWIAKVYAVERGEDPLDMWQKFDSEREAKANVRKDGTDTPFTVVKVTYEFKTPRRPAQ